MPKATRSRRVLIGGLALSGVGIVANALNLAGLDALLPGLMLSVSAAALAAADSPVGQGDGGPQTPVPAPRRRPATITFSVLGCLILLPVVSVAALILAGADPLAIYLVGLGLLALSGLLAVTFLVVFFASRWVGSRRVASPR